MRKRYFQSSQVKQIESNSVCRTHHVLPVKPSKRGAKPAITQRRKLTAKVLIMTAQLLAQLRPIRVPSGLLSVDFTSLASCGSYHDSPFVQVLNVKNPCTSSLRTSSNLLPHSRGKLPLSAHTVSLVYNSTSGRCVLN